MCAAARGLDCRRGGQTLAYPGQREAQRHRPRLMPNEPALTLFARCVPVERVAPAASTAIRSSSRLGGERASVSPSGGHHAQIQLSRLYIQASPPPSFLEQADPPSAQQCTEVRAKSR